MTERSAPAAHPLPALRYTAFSERPEGGNQAGVVLDAAGASEAAMLATAAALGYSETAFAVERDDAARRARIRFFSPLAEVDFCGHATVAAAVALTGQLGPGELVLDTAAGEVLVDAADGRATLTSVPTRTRPAEPAELDAALAALRWPAADLDPELPPHVSFGGNQHLVLAVSERARLAALDYDFDALGTVMRERGWTTLQLLWRESERVFHARDPFPVGGVVEDAATGAAAAALGGYLRARGEHGRFTIRQGEDMGRPSLLVLDVSADDPRARVTGAAVRLPEEP